MRKCRRSRLSHCSERKERENVFLFSQGGEFRVSKMFTSEILVSLCCVCFSVKAGRAARKSLSRARARGHESLSLSLSLSLSVSLSLSLGLSLLFLKNVKKSACAGRARGGLAASWQGQRGARRRPGQLEPREAQGRLRSSGGSDGRGKDVSSSSVRRSDSLSAILDELPRSASLLQLQQQAAAVNGGAMRIRT